MSEIIESCINAIQSENVMHFNNLLAQNSLNLTPHTQASSLLLYALLSENSFFLKKLLPLCKNEVFYHQYQQTLEINDERILAQGNLLEVCLFASGFKMYLRKQSEQMLQKATLIIEHINAWQEFEFARFFSNNEIFKKIFKHEGSYQLIIENLKNEHLKVLLNTHYDSSPPHPALYIFDTCYKKMRVLNKVCDLLNVNEVFEKGNTLFHYYTFKNYPPETDQYTFVHENVVKALLKKGHNPALANEQNKKPEDKISYLKSYKEYQFKYLNLVLKTKTQDIKKSKI